MSYYPSSAYVVKPRSHSTERNQSAAHYYTHPQPVYVTAAPHYVAPQYAPTPTYVAPTSAYVAPTSAYVAPPVAIHSPALGQQLVYHQPIVTAPQYAQYAQYAQYPQYPQYQYGGMQVVVPQSSQPSYQAFNTNPNYQKY